MFRFVNDRAGGLFGLHGFIVSTAAGAAVAALGARTRRGRPETWEKPGEIRGSCWIRPMMEQGVGFERKTGDKQENWG
jgi:hypothetical protein